jgi:hypothetical protein
MRWTIAAMLIALSAAPALAATDRWDARICEKVKAGPAKARTDARPY